MYIKSFSICDFFQNIDDIANELSKLPTIDTPAGDIIPVSDCVSPHVAMMLNSFHSSLKVNEQSSVFRKPYNVIRFEDFDENLVMIGYLAIVPTTIEFKKYIGELPVKGRTDSVFGIDFTMEELVNEYIMEDKWETSETVVLKPNESYFFPPDRFHKITSNLVQVIHLNRVSQPSMCDLGEIENEN